jgi:hypothetical protein
VKKTVSVLLTTAFVIAGCSDKPPLSENVPTNMPKVHMNAGETEIASVVGSYCWFNEAGTGKCVDKAAPPELVKNQQATVIPTSSKVRLQFSEVPKAENLYLWNGGQRQRLDLANDGTLTFNASGGYIVEAFAEWKQGGSTSYVYKFEVQ